MKLKMKRVLIILNLLCALLLSSCRIEGDEEITLHADGSGTIRAYYRLPEKAFSREQSQIVCDGLRELCERTEGLEALEYSHEDAGGDLIGPKFQRLQLKMAFDSKRAIESIELAGDSGEPSEEETIDTIQTLIGEVDLSIRGLTASLDRRVDLAPLLKDISPTLLGDSFFQYTIHFPKAVTESNAHEVTNAGVSLHWKFLLRDYTEEAIQLQAVAPLPVPSWLWCCGGSLLVLGVGGFCFYCVKFKKGEKLG